MNKLTLGMTGSKTFENKGKIKTFIHKLKDNFDGEIVIVGLGDQNGADKYVKKYALELGYNYKEMNPPHTNQNLYSLMSENFYGKPYSARNLFTNSKIFCSYVDKCVVFDDTNTTDKKVHNIIKQMTRSKKKTIILTA
jgi:hypothetical protein